MLYVLSSKLDIRQTLLRVVACALSLGSYCECRGAVLTYGWTATVHSIEEFKGGTELPFNVAIGDVITTTVTLNSKAAGAFNSQTLATRYDQPFSLKYDINNTTLSSNAFTVFVRNDSPFGISTTETSYEIPNLVSDDFSIQSPVFQGPLDSGLLWADNTLFTGSSSTIGSNSLANAIDELNSFESRIQELHFLDNATSGETTIVAFVGNVYVVPEPSGLLVLLMSSFVALWRSR